MSQDYKLFIRAIHGGATIYDQPGGTAILENAGEAQDYLSEFYLSQGYEVLSVDYLGEFILNPDEPKLSPSGPRFAWHLVKKVESKAKKQDDK